ncbi:DNA repair protein RecO [Corynebacterium halotolerans]|uniref:DNA repair protein RecO n=1 Tax=Corynebacterium halotolerans YIM 70093 = DSM 44683 TaxID=1121362 RepID=M1NUB6_9CORY|nr:DNA repair protein RecO [Corynebacterium halotolerans]AGF73077.1 DNA repair protein RecO [Corynebacterium halotolerans YIM 70093 = DSM 44683]
MRRESYRDRAVVVRTHDFGEADRIIVLLTREHGLVRGVAKGVRRSKSRFGSRLQHFVDLDVQLYPGRNLETVTGADTVAYYGSGIIDDYERYTAACAALETAERLAVADADREPWLYDHVTETLARMQTTEHPTLVLDAFLLQAMAHAGWAPSLFDCAQCGASGPHHAFHPAVGGAACTQCRPSGSAEVPEEALHLMWLLSKSHWPAALEIARAGGGRHLADTAHRLTRAHLQWHLEQKVTSLTVMDQS